MALLVILFVGGVILTASMAVSPALNARVEKAITDLIQALGVMMIWAMCILAAYLVFGWLGSWICRNG